MIIDGKHITYHYDEETHAALDDISVQIEAGQFVAILGQNGCGKSTLAKHMNALLSLQEGSLKVSDIDVTNADDLWELRRLCGMVFQNPDNQFVSSIVEEDIAFGLENYDVPDEEIPAKVQAALALVDMEDYARYAPHSLSGGQKQRIALAGVLAMEPDVLIFDEATSMLDPKGRGELLATIEKLRRLGKTILFITHHIEETISADRILLLQEGRLIADGTPREILTDADLLHQAGLHPPVPVQLHHALAEAGVFLPRCPLTVAELVAELDELKGGGSV